MGQARHLGKVLIDMHNCSTLAAPEPDRLKLSPDATYMVAGGLSGFGLKTSKWLAERGARNLVLVGRSGASTQEAIDGVKDLESAGTRVVVKQADVTDFVQMQRVFDDIGETLPPLRGVIHSAMVLDDAILPRIDRARLRRVLAPKTAGAWNLHRLTETLDLDFFVMYSSIASVLGGPAQGNYAAANSFLDSLADYRQTRGLRGLAVNWGAIDQVGVVSRSEAIRENLARIGIDAIDPSRALRILGQLLMSDVTQTFVTSPIDWNNLAQFMPAIKRPRFSTLLSIESQGQGLDDHATIRTRILEAKPEKRSQTLELHLRDLLCKVLGMSPDKLSVQQPLADLGLDSLMAVEIVSQVRSSLGVEVPQMKFLEGINVEKLASYILDQILRGTAEPAKEGGRN
jgi:NAD(P)-dependent dehydrogenase (short-subunit alcohol dehydrogenase family)/acyl carrier protein